MTPARASGMSAPIPAGASATFRFTATVNGPGPFRPEAVVGMDQVDTDPANNLSVTAVTAMLATADITKRDFLASTPGAAAGAALAPTQLPATIPNSRAVVATGAGPGAAPVVEVWDRQTGQLRLSFLAYDPAFTGGVTVAVADVTGDGYPDIITAPQSGGGPNVRVFDGRTGKLVSSFFAFEPSFTGGVNLAVGDVEGDGRPDILAGAGVGGAPRVVVFRPDGTMVTSVYAYDSSFRDGVTVAAGDVLGTGRASVIAGSGAGGGPNVKVIDGTTGAEQLSFFAFDPSFRGGVTVAAGDVDGTGRASILAAPGVGGGADGRGVRRPDRPPGGVVHGPGRGLPGRGEPGLGRPERGRPGRPDRDGQGRRRAGRGRAGRPDRGGPRRVRRLRPDVPRRGERGRRG